MENIYLFIQKVYPALEMHNNLEIPHTFYIITRKCNQTDPNVFFAETFVTFGFRCFKNSKWFSYWIFCMGKQMEICSAKYHEVEIGMAVINGCSVREPLGRNAMHLSLCYTLKDRKAPSP